MPKEGEPTMSEPVAVPRMARILVVDDDSLNRELLARELRRAGHEVAEAGSGEECLDVLRSRAMDLVLLDVVMPRLNGLEVARRIKDDPATRDTFVVLISGRETAEDARIAGLDCGADEYLTRPMSSRELVARLQPLVRVQQANQALRELRAQLEERVGARTVELTNVNAELRLLADERRRAQDVLRELPRHIVAAQEAERLRVARELHDGVSQVLASVQFRLKVLEGRLQPGQRPLRRDTEKAHALLDRALHEVRRISENLRPSELDELGLLSAIRGAGEEFTERTGVKVRLSTLHLPETLAPELSLTVYRIVQEALNNVQKHARASRVKIRIAREDGVIVLKIEDDGRGFAVDGRARGRRKPGFGLVNMKERAAFLGGTFEIESGPGAGTRLTVRLPSASTDGEAIHAQAKA